MALGNFFGGQFLGGGFFGSSVTTPVGGEKPAGRSKRRKQKLYYIERKDEILVFDTPAEVKTFKRQEKVIKPRIKVEPGVVIKKADLQAFVEVSEEFEAFQPLIDWQNAALLREIYQQYLMWLDEQDIEILLLH